MKITAENAEQFLDRWRTLRAAFHDASPLDGDLEAMDFSGALLAVKDGHHITRGGWNAPNQYVTMQAGYPNGIPINGNTAAATGLPEGTVCAFRPYLLLHTARHAGELHTFVPWAPTVSDVLADDWRIVTPHP